MPILEGIAAHTVVTAVGGAAMKLGAGAVAVVGPLLGFGKTGVVAGSMAAAAQSYAGNVAAGSVFAKVTGAVMGGAAAGVTAPVISAAGAAAAAYWVYTTLF